MKLSRPSNPYLFAILFVPFVLLVPLLLSGKVLFWGTVSLQFLPWRVQAYRTLLQGQLPLWNPQVGMGAPLAANYQSALFYPPNWLVIFLQWIGGVGWAAWAQTLLVALHLLWAGLGMAFLARRLGLSNLGQAVCGLAYALSGYLVARSGFLSINAAVAWVPWVLYGATELSIENFSVKRLVNLSVCVGLLLLTGHAQTAWYTILLVFAWSGYWSLQFAHSHNKKNIDAEHGVYRGIKLLESVLGKWGQIILGILLGGLLAAVQLLPTAELLRQSQRASGVDYNFAMTYSFWPWHLMTLLAPNFFGSPVSNNYWGYGNYWEDALYIGLLPVIIAIATILSVTWNVLRRKKEASEPEAPIKAIGGKRGFIYLLAGLISVSFLFALGKNTPVFPWLYRNIPSFAFFQAPARFSMWMELGLVLLAGIGVSWWRRPEGRGLYWTRLATAGAGAISIGSGLTWYFLKDVSPTFINATALMGLIGVAIGILSLLAPRHERPEVGQQHNKSLWGWAVMALLSADLLLADWGINPGIDLSFYTDRSANNDQVREMSQGGRIYLSSDDEYTLKFDRFMRFDRYNIDDNWQNLRNSLLPNLNILDGIPSVNNFDPILPARYVTWMEKLNQLREEPSNYSYHQMLDLMNVGVVERVDSKRDIGVAFQPEVAGERLRWVPCARYVSDGEQAWNQLLSGDVDFEKQVILEQAGITSKVNCWQGEGPATVRWETDSPNRIVAQVTSSSSGWLFLSDVWYPGWQAEVNGITTPIRRANYLFRAISVPAGDHRVVITYRPSTFWWGAAISLAAWGGLGFTIFLLWKTNKSRQHERPLPAE